LLPEKQNGLGEDFPTKYFLDILSDFKPEDTPLLPSVAAALMLSRTTVRKDNPGVHCLPRGSPPMGDTIPEPFKLVQTPDLIVMLIEDGTKLSSDIYRRPEAPEDPTPSWFGYSVGKWEGDTLVVDTIGFNDRGWLDAVGHTRSESMHVTERFHRRDFGHMDMQITLDDPRRSLNLSPSSSVLVYSPTVTCWSFSVQKTKRTWPTASTGKAVAATTPRNAPGAFSTNPPLAARRRW